jgi:hypothetical protein
MQYGTLSGQSSGNISSKTGVGDYFYNGPQPHAVSMVDHPASEMLSASSIEQNITYTAFSKIETIAEGVNSVSLTYGSDEQRKKMEVRNTAVLNGGLIADKYYQPSYERTRYYTNGILNGTERTLDYIFSPDGLCAIHVGDENNKDSLYYIYTDHLGSIVMITDDRANVMEELSYDAWGRRRNSADWTYTSVSGNHIFGRGYTGHEHLEPFSLINMNGRVYDPFIS